MRIALYGLIVCNVIMIVMLGAMPNEACIQAFHIACHP